MKRTPGSRRDGRALALQFIFMLDHNSTPFEEALPAFMAFEKDNDEPLAPVEKSRVFCERLVRGVVEHWKELDSRIKNTAANFTLHRIGGVERAVLRLGAYEMIYCMETPPVVAINEAVELARQFVSEEASRFVNGVLDRIRGTLDRPARTAVTPHSPVERMEEQMKRAARELGERSGERAEDFSPGRETPPAQG